MADATPPHRPIPPTERRGRPRAPVTKCAATTWIATTEYDRLARLAQKRDQSVSAYLSDLITTHRRR